MNITILCIFLQYSVHTTLNSHWHHFGPKSDYTIPVYSSPISVLTQGVLTDKQLQFAVHKFSGDI